MAPNELAELLDILRSRNVLYFKSEAVEVQLGPDFREPVVPADSDETEKTWRGLSREDLHLLGAE